MLARYLPLWTTSAAYHVERAGTALEIAWIYSDRTASPHRHDCEMSLMAAASLGGLLEAGRWRPQEVHFRHVAPEDPSEHLRLLRAPVRFGMPENLIVCDADVSATPVASVDPALHGLLRELAEQRLGTRPRPTSIVDDTRVAIVKSLPAGNPQLSGVARALGIGARTLQRRLVAGGTTFDALLTSVRRDRATHALVNSEISIGELATQLGYASAGDLHRAFRSWVGVGPAAYRRRHRAPLE